jgi:hypothetical protein
MFALDFLGKMVELVVGDIAKKRVGASLDSKRRFARELLGYYEELKNFQADLLLAVALLQRERELVATRRITQGTAEHLNALSCRMTDRLAALAKVYDHDLYAYARPERGTKAKARRNHAVVEIMDDELSKLMSVAYRNDEDIISLLSRLSLTQFNWEKQEVSFLAMTNASVEDFDAVLGRSSHGPQRFLQILSLTNEQDYQQLLNDLNESGVRVEGLVKRLAGFMKEKFSLEDLL